MAAIDVDTIQAAIHAWAVRGSGLANNKVVWTLGERAPSGTYIHLRLDFDTVGVDFIHNTVNPSPTLGNEAVYTVYGGRKGTITITCFSHDDYNSGQRSPQLILTDVLTALSLPSINAIVKAAKVGTLKFGSPTNVDVTINAVEFEPRAYVKVTFHTVASMSETGPAITSVEISGQVGTPGGDTLDLSLDVERLLSP